MIGGFLIGCGLFLFSPRLLSIIEVAFLLLVLGLLLKKIGLAQVKTQICLGLLIGILYQNVYCSWLMQPNALSLLMDSDQTVTVEAKILNVQLHSSSLLSNLIGSDNTKINPKAAKYELEVTGFRYIGDQPAHKRLNIAPMFWAPSLKILAQRSSFDHHDSKLQFNQGDLVVATLRLRSLTAYENDFGFNYRRYLLSKNITAVGVVKGEIQKLKSSYLSQNQHITNNYLIAQNSIRFSSVSDPLEGSPLALITGNKSLMSQDSIAKVNHLGIGHLFAISGLHIGLIFLGVRFVMKIFIATLYHIAYRFGFRYATRISKPYLRDFFTLIIVWLYVLFIGSPPSGERAVLLLTAFLAIRFTQSHISLGVALLQVCFVSVIFEPLSYLQTSWWLSFYAVAGIVLFANLTNQEYYDSKLRLAFAFQCFIAIWMLPLVAYFFAGFNFVSIFVNFLFVPIFVSVVMPLCAFLVIALGFSLPAMAEVILESIHTIFSYLTQFSDYFYLDQYWQRFSGESARLWLITLLFIPLSLLVASLNLYLKRNLNLNQNLKKNITLENVGTALGRKNRRFNSPIFTVFLIFVGIAFLIDVKLKLTGQVLKTTNLNQEGHSDLYVHVFDVGQGTSLLLKQRNIGILFDLGPIFNTGANATSRVILPALVGVDVKSLEAVIITHLDSDHKGEPKELYRQFGPFTPYNCHNLMDLPKFPLWRHVRFELLYPRLPAQKELETYNTEWNVKSKNDQSCVVKVSDLSSSQSLLIVGDITGKVEQKLVDQHYAKAINLTSDILISAHHGSKHSSILPFINAVSPQLVVHSTGVNNRFEMPDKAVIKRFDRYYVRQLNTAEHGQIDINLTDLNMLNSMKWRLNSWTPFWKRQNPFSIHEQIR